MDGGEHLQLKSFKALLNKAYAPSTRARRLTVLKQLAQTKGDWRRLIGAWHRSLRPSSLITYIATLKSVLGPLPQHERVLLATALRGAQKSKSQPVNQATPATPIQLMTIVGVPYEICRLLFITASRFADIKAMTMTVWRQQETTPHNPRRSVCQIHMGHFKSDVFHQRITSKFIADDPQRIRRAIRYGQQMPYTTFLKAVAPLTAHSFRRGAATQLATLGHSMETIALLTLHTRKVDPGQAVRRYVSENPNQLEPRTQIMLAAQLQNLVK